MPRIMTVDNRFIKELNFVAVISYEVTNSLNKAIVLLYQITGVIQRPSNNKFKILINVMTLLQNQEYDVRLKQKCKIYCSFKTNISWFELCGFKICITIYFICVIVHIKQCLFN